MKCLPEPSQLGIGHLLNNNEMKREKLLMIFFHTAIDTFKNGQGKEGEKQ